MKIYLSTFFETIITLKSAVGHTSNADVIITQNVNTMKKDGGGRGGAVNWEKGAYVIL